jgi:hypothetical protein
MHAAVRQAMAEDFDYTDEVRGLQVPTLVVAADADMAPPSHYVEVFNLLDGGLRDGGWAGEGRPRGGHALAILPGLTHYDVFRSPLFAAVTLAFLDRPELTRLTSPPGDRLARSPGTVTPAATRPPRLMREPD